MAFAPRRVLLPHHPPREARARIRQALTPQWRWMLRKLDPDLWAGLRESFAFRSITLREPDRLASLRYQPWSFKQIVFPRSCGLSSPYGSEEGSAGYEPERVKKGETGTRAAGLPTHVPVYRRNSCCRLDDTRSPERLGRAAARPSGPREREWIVLK